MSHEKDTNRKPSCFCGRKQFIAFLLPNPRFCVQCGNDNASVAALLLLPVKLESNFVAVFLCYFGIDST